MRGGSSRRTTTRPQRQQITARLRDGPRTNEVDNIDSQPEETTNLQQDEQQEDNGVSASQRNEQQEQQEEQEPAPDSLGRLRATVVADCLQPSEKCSRVITTIIKQKLDKQGAWYGLVSKDTKKLYFEEFKKFVIWDPAINSLVEKAFDKKARTRYGDFISQIKKKPKPEYIQQVIWDEWVKLWKLPKADAASKRNAKNRRCGKENEAAPSTHVCGSVTYATTEKRLEEQTQKTPTAYQLFLHSHTMGHDGQNFISDKARDVNNKILALMEEKRAAGIVDIDEDKLFFDVVGGKKRKRIYGMGQADHIYYPEVCSPSSVTQADIDERVTQKVSELLPTLEANMRERITNEVRGSFEEKIAEQNRLLSKMEERMEEHFRQQQQRNGQ